MESGSCVKHSIRYLPVSLSHTAVVKYGRQTKLELLKGDMSTRVAVGPCAKEALRLGRLSDSAHGGHWTSKNKCITRTSIDSSSLSLALRTGLLDGNTWKQMAKAIRVTDSAPPGLFRSVLESVSLLVYSARFALWIESGSLGTEHPRISNPTGTQSGLVEVEKLAALTPREESNTREGTRLGLR
ncbi:hypothetical protein IW262DRAFT_1295690 [Armillaria fumosa]|nr:hypothetical protein IW262DRAFT_1295690 [Armillaria fumosa]